LTRLNTECGPAGTAPETDLAFDQVKMYVEIDGTPVPVSEDDLPASAPADDEGKVVFCNRAYQRSVQNAEGTGGGFGGHSGRDPGRRRRDLR
jgi:hypothetical protein